jgi:hypothetical protein
MLGQPPGARCSYLRTADNQSLHCTPSLQSEPVVRCDSARMTPVRNTNPPREWSGDVGLARGVAKLEVRKSPEME